MTARGLRVVHLASGREWRGGQNQVLLLARALADLPDPIDQVVVTGSGSRLADRLRAAGLPVHPVQWRAGLSPSALGGVVREAVRRPGLIHAHDAHALTLAGIGSFLTRTPFVVTRRVDFHIRRRGFWARAARVIAISDAVQRVLVEDGLAPGRIVMVPSGIDVEQVRCTRPGPIRAELGLPERAPLAVAVGALVVHKDHVTLVEAAAALQTRRPDLHWAIVGEGPLRPALKARIEGHGLTGRVHLLGHLAEPLRLLAAADVFVMCSTREGLGTSVLDAMALDVPIAGTEAGGIPEMLHHGAGLLSPPGDGPSLAESVDRLLSDPALRESVRRVARRRVEQFSATSMAKGVLAVYRSVLGEH